MKPPSSFRCVELETDTAMTFDTIDKAVEAVARWTDQTLNPRTRAMIQTAIMRAAKRPVNNHAYGFAWSRT